MRISSLNSSILVILGLLTLSGQAVHADEGHGMSKAPVKADVHGNGGHGHSADDHHQPSGTVDVHSEMNRDGHHGNSKVDDEHNKNTDAHGHHGENK